MTIEPISQFSTSGIQNSLSWFIWYAEAMSAWNRDAQTTAGLIGSQGLVEANAAVIRTEDQIYDSMLNALA